VFSHRTLLSSPFYTRTNRILFICLFGLIAVLNHMLMGISTRIIYKATDMNGYVAILIGTGVTVLVQSSSILTSTLTPLVGMGVLRLEQMYPLTLGANLGTTFTAIMASLVATGTDALQVALAHLFFNLTGILIWYPIPFMRSVPLYLARQLGAVTRIWRGFPLIYIAAAFFLIPLLFLGLSVMFEQKKVGLTVLAGFITALVGTACLYTGYWCHFKGGKHRCADCFRERERRRVAEFALPDDMELVKAELAALKAFTGMTGNGDDESSDSEDGSIPTNISTGKRSDWANDEMGI